MTHEPYVILMVMDAEKFDYDVSRGGRRRGGGDMNLSTWVLLQL